MTDSPDPDQKDLFDHITEVSKNARATWFGLIALLAFVGVTLLGHKDADFFAFGAETRLPVLNVDIPVRSFFTFAPVLVAALYIYLHLYLMSLWDALADLKQPKGGAPIADRVYPWLISHAALWYRNRTRKGPDGQPPERSAAPRALGWLVVAVSLLLGWLFGLAVLFGLWFRSLPAHEEWLTLWTALCLWAAIAVGWTSFRAARTRMTDRTRAEVARADRRRYQSAGALALLLALLSWEATEGSGILKYRVTKGDGTVEWRLPLSPADLAEAELTRKPPGWLPWHLWREDFEERFRRREGIDPGTDLADERKRDFEKEAKERYAEYIAQLDAPDLRDLDLRTASMSRAFLPGADLRGAEMQGADLFGAEMQGAVLREAEMQGAVLGRAEMQGADLRGAEMQGADLFGAEMQGADLGRAEMQGADCTGATLLGAPVQSADLTCTNLTQDQLEEVIGDRTTIVPDGLHVWSCWQTPPETLDETLATYPESVREERRAEWLCGPGRKRHATGSWPFEKRYLTDFEGIR